MQKPMIKLETVSYSYPNHNLAVKVIYDLSMEVNEGEFVIILGSNGSGKSTLAKLMAGILHPTSGRVFVRGITTNEPNKAKEIRQNISLVLQNPENQIIASIVGEDVALGPENLGFEPDEVTQSVDEALEKVGMAEHQLDDAAFLSGGQKQRIAIASILAMQTKCVIFDEATAMLDPQGRVQVQNLVQNLNQKEGLTVIWLTHLIEEIKENHRLIILDQGRILLDGRAKEILSQGTDLEELGLAPPLALRLAKKMRKRGIELKADPFNIDELVELICQLKFKS